MGKFERELKKALNPNTDDSSEEKKPKQSFWASLNESMRKVIEDKEKTNEDNAGK